MEKEKGLEKDCKAHCLVFPFPAQGHINPMLQFSKRLQLKGVKATLVTTHFTYKRTFSSSSSSSSSIPVETISDGFDDEVESHVNGIDTYMARFREVGSPLLANLIRTGRFHCVVNDPGLPWVLDVAKEFGLLATAFFTQPLAVYNVYYHVYRKLLKIPISRQWQEKEKIALQA